MSRKQAKVEKPRRIPSGVANKRPNKPVQRFAGKNRVNSRRKGIRGELEARNLWAEFYPGCKRSFGQARKGYEQPDLIGGGIEKEWYVEVKRPHRKPSYDQILKWSAKLVGDFGFYCKADMTHKPNHLVLMWRHDGEREWCVHYRWPDTDWDYLSWDKFRKNILVELYLRAQSSATPPTD